MSYNRFGRVLSITTFGESHGPAIGCVIDGFPPGVAISAEEIRDAMLRRATGRSRHTSQRREAEDVQILSGTFEGRTTGTPIALVVYNTDARSKDYTDIAYAISITIHCLFRIFWEDITIIAYAISITILIFQYV